MTDTDAIKARHLDPTKNRGRTYYAGHIEVDLAACVAEIERLREDVALIQQENAALHTALLEIRSRNRDERAAERAAVVAYLRGLADDYGVCIDLSLAEQADKIERGEHRRKEDKP